MTTDFRRFPRLHLSLLAIALLGLLAGSPLQAAITTAYSCASSGSNGNHDSVFNGFFVSGLSADNVHTVQIFYTADVTGSYNLVLKATNSSYGGTQVGSTLNKTVTLTSGVDTAVTWSFGDAAFISGHSIYFVHNNTTGPGNPSFNTTHCAGDTENIGTSSNNNGFSVAVAITTNSTPVPPACVANGTTLCIDNVAGDKRFQITGTFNTVQGTVHSGNGQAIPTSSLGVTEGGLFWFFDPKNPEMLIKVLNGCGVNSHFWVFYAATTNVGFNFTVKDTSNGHTISFANSDLHAADPVQDVNALVCP